MDRATILQRTMDAAMAASGMLDAPRMPDALAGMLYIYCVRRNFPSAEVLRNKLLEWDGKGDTPKPFEDEPEELRLFLNVFCAAAQQLEELAQETIGEFEADMAGAETDGIDAGDGSAAGGAATRGECFATPHDAASEPGAATDVPAAIAADMSAGLTPTPPDAAQAATEKTARRVK